MGVRENLQSVLDSISRAAARAGRDPQQITLVAVSKKQPISLMEEYRVAAEVCGVRIVFGENYVQELKAKRAQLGESIEFHLIGPLQSNKIRDAVAAAEVIQSVHSLSILEGIAKESIRRGKRQRIFLQVNIGKDPAKSGFVAEDLPAVLGRLGGMKEAVDVLGLMTITPFYEQAELSRPEFKNMSALRATLHQQGQAELFHNSTILLSMGMSADFDIAIEEGADLVRVGTALFGERL